MLDFVEPLELMGVPGSPYTRKMLALLRYRRIRYRLLPGTRSELEPDPERFRSRPQPRVPLLPTFYARDEEGNELALCDSTPLIRDFERCFKGRAVVPADPALAFLDYLLEDYADEWLTKAMFHYRWTYEADIAKGSQLLPRWSNISAPEEAVVALGQEIAARQIARLRYVGSNATTRETIESSFVRFLDLLDAHLRLYPFLLGRRPSACDFAVYGQLVCLALVDPTPQALVLSRAPRVYAWTEVMEDLSGYELMEGDWFEIEELPDTLLALLTEVGRLYVPYLLANAEAVAAGADSMVMTLDGRPWQQQPFTYQARCLDRIRAHYQALEASEQERLVNILTRSGVFALLQQPESNPGPA